MKKVMLTIALIVTLCNVAAGIAYGAVCRSSAGVRTCGELCIANANGTCNCDGNCTADERDWVAAGGKLAVLEEGDY